MSLREQLDAIGAQMKSQLPKSKQELMARSTEALRATGIEDGIIKAGQALPPFALPDQDGTIVRSSDLLSRGPLVIAIFRGVWCPYCNAELKALGEATADLRAAGAEVVAVTPQGAASSREAVQASSLPFNMLTDQGLAWSEKLGLPFTLSDELRATYEGFGIDLPSHNGDESWRLPVPARMIIRPDGTVVHVDADVDYTRRPEPSDTVSRVRALSVSA